jgi:hypothetical protein
LQVSKHLLIFDACSLFGSALYFSCVVVQFLYDVDERYCRWEWANRGSLDADADTEDRETYLTQMHVGAAAAFPLDKAPRRQSEHKLAVARTPEAVAVQTGGVPEEAATVPLMTATVGCTVPARASATTRSVRRLVWRNRHLRQVFLRGDSIVLIAERTPIVPSP